MGTNSIIQVQGLTKAYGDFLAVDGVEFAVEEREIFGFLGPNGAGKTTTINMLATLLRPTRGSATLAGFDIRTQPNQVRQSIGMVFQDPSLDDRLTADENLRFHAMLYNVPRRVLPERMEQVLRIVGLTERRRSLVRTFSGGMKRRLEIARGLLHHPRVLFLDEPTVGLDPQTRNAIWEHVRRLRAEVGITVFMTTHYMDEAENCDRIAIIDHGKIQALDTPEALKRMVGGDKIIVVGDPALRDDLAARYGVPVQEVDGALHFQAPLTLPSPPNEGGEGRVRGGGAEFVPRVVVDFRERIKSIQVKQPSLDDVFLKLTGHAIREQEGTEVDRMRLAGRLWTGRR
jgi:ABC-2 type transport system ATP-binding protein